MTRRPWLVVVVAVLAAATGTAAAEVEDRPWLGISYQPSGSIGVLVTNVFEESGALASGLRIGDEIVEVEGIPVNAGTPSISPLIEPRAIGDKLTVRVYRDGRVLTLYPVLSRRMTDSELLHVQLVGKRAPAFTLVPASPAQRGHPIDDSALAGKVGVLAWFHIACRDCPALINRVSSWADGRRGGGLVAIAGVGGPLQYGPDQLQIALRAVLASAPILLPIGIDQDAWLKYGVLENYGEMMSLIVVDSRGFVRMAAAIPATDDAALDNVFAAAEGLLGRRSRR